MIYQTKICLIVLRLFMWSGFAMFAPAPLVIYTRRVREHYQTFSDTALTSFHAHRGWNPMPSPLGALYPLFHTG